MKKNNLRKSIGVLLLALCMVLSMTSISAFAAEVPASESESSHVSTDAPVLTITRIGDCDVLDDSDTAAPAALDSYVEFTGNLAPGARTSGTFKVTGLTKKNVSVIAGASNTGGSLTLAFIAEIIYVPCNGSANVVGRYQLPPGTYSYSLENHTSNTTRAVLNIYNS